MGLAVAKRAGRGRRRRRGLVAEINVTPFVDVMLVLLIVFMVTAPLLTAGIKVELPKTKAEALPADKEPLTVTILSNGEVYLQDTAVTMDELLPRLQAIAQTGYDQRIFIRGDNTAQYGRIAEVMALMSSAGYRNLGLVTEPVEKPAKRAATAP
ncbi:MAG: protein TolR [Alphaproteobacteria bacterium]|nr:protein TolR [Alphaproteobacteria bacterium]